MLNLIAHVAAFGTRMRLSEGEKTAIIGQKRALTVPIDASGEATIVARIATVVSHIAEPEEAVAAATLRVRVAERGILVRACARRARQLALLAEEAGCTRACVVRKGRDARARATILARR